MDVILPSTFNCVLLASLPHNWDSFMSTLQLVNEGKVIPNKNIYISQVLGSVDGLLCLKHHHSLRSWLASISTFKTQLKSASPLLANCSLLFLAEGGAPGLCVQCLWETIMTPILPCGYSHTLCHRILTLISAVQPTFDLGDFLVPSAMAHVFVFVSKPLSLECATQISMVI